MVNTLITYSILFGFILFIIDWFNNSIMPLTHTQQVGDKKNDPLNEQPTFFHEIAPAIIYGAVTLVVSAAGYFIAEGKEFEAQNTLHNFLKGKNGDFSGSDFNANHYAVRVVFWDTSITGPELEKWIGYWQNGWLDKANHGKTSREKWWKNRKAHINTIYQLMRQERAYVVVPEPFYKTLAEARIFWGAKPSNLSVEQNFYDVEKEYLEKIEKRRNLWLKRTDKQGNKIDTVPGLEAIMYDFRQRQRPTQNNSIFKNPTSNDNQLRNGDYIIDPVDGSQTTQADEDPNTWTLNHTTSTQSAGNSILPAIILGLLAIGVFFKRFIKK